MARFERGDRPPGGAGRGPEGGTAPFRLVVGGEEREERWICWGRAVVRLGEAVEEV